MAVTVEKAGDVAVAIVNIEQFDAACADQFRKDMAPVLSGTKKLVLDLSAVQFIDSRACGAILSCLKKLGEVGGELKICRASDFVREVFGLIRLHRICEILATREDAVRAFAATEGPR